MNPLALTVDIERFPIAGTFTIARGSRTEAVVVTATVSDGRISGRGECVPYTRYGETVEGVAQAIRDMDSMLAEGLDRFRLASLMRPGAARNALDCALWDYEAKRNGTSVAALIGIDPKPVTTAYTLSLGTPESMHQAARAASHRPLLKVKLGAEGDPERIRAVREGAPKAQLIVDANEGWRGHLFEDNLAACVAAGVRLIEQPLPAATDAGLGSFSHPIPICADESCHDRAGLADLAARYEAVNVKLDKTGGLTEALALIAEARRLGLLVMVGCMVGTSLAMAPALLAAQGADFVDLDGPLLLAADRPDGLTYTGSLVQPPAPALWG